MPSGPFTGYAFTSDRLPYSRLLLDEIGNWQRHVITGPTQSGKSFHAFVLVIMYHLFERQEDVIVGIPDINMAGDKWAEDIKPVIESSSYANLLPKSGAGSKGAGKLTKITFENGRFMRFMSAGGNDKQRAGATARVLIVTETDGMDNVGGTSQEGQTPISQLEGRIRAYGDEAFSSFECTVSTEDAFTWKQYMAGTASRIVHKCKACDKWVSPERADLIGWQDATNEIEAGELGRFSCPDCGIFYSEEDRIEMNGNAMLVHRGQEVTPGGEITGEVPKTNTLGFRWSAFQNLLNPTSKIAVDEWLAHNSEDPELAGIVQSQQVWAVPVKDTATEKIPISVAVIRGSDDKYNGRCSGIPRGEVPVGSSPVTCFIDVAKRLLQWSVEVKVEKRIHVVDYGFYQTPQPDLVGDEAAIEDGLHELCAILTEKYPDIKLGLIDVGNWREKILTVIPTLPGVWMPSRGLPIYKHPKQQTQQVKNPSDGNRHYYRSRDGASWVINFDPDTLKHRVHSGFMISPSVGYGVAPGCITLFGDNPHEHTEYAQQVTAEEFRSVFEKGKGVTRKWHKTRRDNHMLDCCVGNMLARMVVATSEVDKSRTSQRKYGVISKK